MSASYTDPRNVRDELRRDRLRAVLRVSRRFALGMLVGAVALIALWVLWETRGWLW